jgi:hypothetical protein
MFHQPRRCIEKGKSGLTIANNPASDAGTTPRTPSRSSKYLQHLPGPEDQPTSVPGWLIAANLNHRNARRRQKLSQMMVKYFPPFVRHERRVHSNEILAALPPMPPWERTFVTIGTKSLEQRTYAHGILTNHAARAVRTNACLPMIDL